MFGRFLKRGRNKKSKMSDRRRQAEEVGVLPAVKAADVHWLLSDSKIKKAMGRTKTIEETIGKSGVDSTSGSPEVVDNANHQRNIADTLNKMREELEEIGNDQCRVKELIDESVCAPDNNINQELTATMPSISRGQLTPEKVSLKLLEFADIEDGAKELIKENGSGPSVIDIFAIADNIKRLYAESQLSDDQLNVKKVLDILLELVINQSEITELLFGLYYAFEHNKKAITQASQSLLELVSNQASTINTLGYLDYDLQCRNTNQKLSAAIYYNIGSTSIVKKILINLTELNRRRLEDIQFVKDTLESPLSNVLSTAASLEAASNTPGNRPKYKQTSESKILSNLFRHQLAVLGLISRCRDALNGGADTTRATALNTPNDQSHCAEISESLSQLASKQDETTQLLSKLRDEYNSTNQGSSAASPDTPDNQSSFRRPSDILLELVSKQVRDMQLLNGLACLMCNNKSKELPVTPATPDDRLNAVRAVMVAPPAAAQGVLSPTS